MTIECFCRRCGNEEILLVGGSGKLLRERAANRGQVGVQNMRLHLQQRWLQSRLEVETKFDDDVDELDGVVPRAGLEQMRKL